MNDKLVESKKYHLEIYATKLANLDSMLLEKKL